MRALQQESGAYSLAASEELQTEQRSSQHDVLHDALRVHTGIIPEIDELHKGCSTGTKHRPYDDQKGVTMGAT
jgi:hypothetical protein